MEQDIDKKLYNDYLRGNTQAFELLYLRYKNKIHTINSLKKIIAYI